MCVFALGEAEVLFDLATFSLSPIDTDCVCDERKPKEKHNFNLMWSNVTRANRKITRNWSKLLLKNASRMN